MGRKQFRTTEDGRAPLADNCIECGGKVYARDLCQRHYMRGYRKGLSDNQPTWERFNPVNHARKALRHILDL